MAKAFWMGEDESYKVDAKFNHKLVLGPVIKACLSLRLTDRTALSKRVSAATAAVVLWTWQT